jgi:hypothetical protein
MSIDFSKGPSIRQHKSGRIRDRGNTRDHRPVNAEGKLLTPKQIRARARRKAERSRKNGKAIMSDLEFEALYKPVDEWDLEELARGRPRDVDGNFRGRKPKWITREVHERAMEQFQLAIKTEMGAMTPTALTTLQYLLESEETDDRGKPLVPASTKFQTSAFLVEHLLGKPKQRMETDISVKLQGILAGVMVNPNEALAPPEQGGMGGYQLAHMPGHTIPMGIEGPAKDDDEDLEAFDE